MNLAQLVADNKSRILLSRKDKNSFIKMTEQINSIGECDLVEIKGVGESTIKSLLENGINSQQKVKEIGEEGIKSLKLNILSQRALLNFIK